MTTSTIDTALPSRSSPTRPNDIPSKKPDLAKDRILDIAFSLFSKRGYAGVSMQEIANDVGMTKAALYYHFADKKALFLGVFMRSLSTFTEQMNASIAADLPLDTTLRQIATFVLEHGRGEGRRINTDVHTFVLPEERATVFAHVEHPSAAIMRYLEAQQVAGHIRPDVDVGFAGPLFLSMISGQVRRFSAASINGLPLADMSDEETAGKIVTIFLDGIE